MLIARFRATTLLLLLTVLTSCNLVSAPKIDATGFWSGSATAANGVTQPVTFSLTESQVEGDAPVYGTLTVANIPLNVSGKRRENRLALTYTDASSVVLVAATINGNSMSGELNILTGGVADAKTTFTVTR